MIYVILYVSFIKINNETWKLNRPPRQFTITSTSHVINNIQLQTFLLLIDRLAYNIKTNKII